MKILLITLLLLFSLTTRADMFNMDFEKTETDIWLYQKSYHFDRDQDYNESHPLIGIRHNNILALAFKNSHSEDSIAMLFYDELVEVNSYSTIFYTIGLSSGYEEVTGNEPGIIPYGFIGFDFHTPNDKYALVVNTLPGIIVTAGFRMRFQKKVFLIFQKS